MRFRGAAGSFTPIRGWRHNGDPRLAPLRRSSAGAYTPILTWLLYADHRLAPIRRSLTRVRHRAPRSRSFCHRSQCGALRSFTALPAARHHIADRAAPSRSYADAAYTLAELQARANQTPAEVVARSLLTSETDPRNAVAVLISPYGSEVAQA